MSQTIVDSVAFTNPIVAPSDGDDMDAASVLVGLQGLANRTRLLAHRTGVRDHEYTSAASPNPETTVQTFSTTSFVDLTSAARTIGADTNSEVAIGDRIVVVASLACTAALAADEFVFAEARASIQSASLAESVVPGAWQQFSIGPEMAGGSAVDPQVLVTLMGGYTVAHAEGHTVKLQCRVDSGPVTAFGVKQSWSLLVVALKAQGIL